MNNNELNSLLDRLLHEGESEYVEFKLNNTNKEMIGERLSALANGACLHQKHYGYLIFGIQDSPIKKIGTDFSPKEIKAGNEPLEHWLLQRLNPRIDFKFYEFFTPDNAKIALIQIPAAFRQPVMFSYTAYIRIQSITRKLQDFPEKERKIWNSNETSLFETETALSDCSAQDVVQLLDTQLIFDGLLKLPYPTTQQGVIEKLLSEKFIVRTNGHFNIINLGAILFAKDLNSFDRLKRKAIRVIQYDGNSKLKTFKDDTWHKGYAVEFEGLMKYISGLLPSNEEISKAFRKDIQVYPPLAVRELVANALIHQDFSQRGISSMVEIYQDRIEISNPGQPMVETQRFIDEYQSRNEDIASVMRRMGLSEEKGSGIDKVIGEVELFQLPAPDFQVKLTHTKAILYAPQKLNQMGKNDKTRACYQHCCLKYTTSTPMTNQTMRERFGIEDKNSAIASRIIKETTEMGLIKEQNPDSNSRKYASYVPFWA